MNEKDFLELICDFQSLPKMLNSTSIFDISGYPHYENVSSNILAFYLNPNSEHGLGNLLLSSILYFAEESRIYQDQNNVLVSREVSTNNGGRLDILVETDTSIIGIENKIFHTLENDLYDYSKSIDNWANPKKLDTFKVVLSIRKEKVSNDFINITYSDFFKQVKSRLGSYVSTSSQKWVLYLIDFIDTIERLEDRNMNFNNTDQFFIKNEEKINELLNARNRFLSKLYRMVSTLNEMINEEDMPKHCIRRWVYSKKVLVHDFKVDGNLIAFDLVISPKGWELQLFSRDTRYQSYLNELIKENNLSSIVIEITKDSRYILMKYDLEESLKKIKNELDDRIKKFISVVDDKSVSGGS